MKRKAVMGIMLTLLFVGILSFTSNIQKVEASGTIYIRDDGSIWGTTDIMTVDNVTYTFTDDINGSIVIERDNIVVDGASYTVQGTGAENSIGIKMWARSNVTIRDVEVTDFYCGMALVYSSKNTLTGNTASSNNHHGIYLYSSSDNTLTGNIATNNEWHGISLDISSNNVLTDNNASNNDDGIYVWDSSDNVFVGNIASSNNRYGIWVRTPNTPGNNVLTDNAASNNNYGIYFQCPRNYVLSGNTASNNLYNFGVEGYSLSDFINYVDTSNTVDGRPIYYLIDEANAVIDTQTNAGTIYAINCNNVTIRDLTLAKNEYGVFLWGTSNSKIERVTTSNNGYGIYLRGSSNNVFFHNNFINNTKYGSVQQVSSYGSINIWDNGYPSGGNYWSDHACTGNPSDGSQPYVIDADNIDHYPFQNPNGWLRVHNIDTGLNYTTIQEAIDAPETSDEHTIFVDSGIYYEYVVVNKMIRLIGESQLITVIDGWVDVTAHGVVISGFAIGGFTAFGMGMTMYFGIRLSGVTDCRISDNIIFNTGRGIWLENSPNNVLSDNLLVANTLYNVYLSESSNNTISQNNITSIELNGGFKLMNYGIEIYRSSNNTITQNNVTQSQRAIHIEGITMYGEDASNNKIIENNIEHWEWGISLGHSSNNTIVGNNVTALGSRGEIEFLPMDSTGLSLYRSFNNSIIQNNIKQNREGVKLVDSSLNNILGNNLTENYYGIRLQGSQVNSLIGNNITHSRVIFRDDKIGVVGYGILISYPYYSNLLRNNSIAGYMYNFGVEGYMAFYAQNVDETNTVDGKPVYYWVNQREGQIPSDAGYVAIVNSTNIKVEGLDLKNNYQGILVAHSNNITIRQNNITNNLQGIEFNFSFNNTVLENNIITNNENGVLLRESCNNNIYRNNITNPYETGIQLDRSSNNTFSQNKISNNTNGICLFDSLDNIISGNDITFNYYGIWLVFSYSSSFASSNNRFYHNHFINNTNHVGFGPKSMINVWDDGYPSGGNYWSDYADVDLYTGPYQNETGSDGIWDHPYVIDENNQDNYPLVNPWPWTPIETSVRVNDQDYPVTIVSNTTISQIVATKNILYFKSSGPTGQKAYINVFFPMVNTTGIKVYKDDAELTPPPFPLINTNGTHYIIYFEFTLSTHNIAIQFAPIEYSLTVTSSPITGVAFTINGVSKITPYTEWLLEGSYTLGMPETHNGYVWSHWLEDGDSSRIKTITLPGTTWTAVYVPQPTPPTCVGGEMILMEKTEFIPSPWTSPFMALALVIILATTVLVGYVKHEKQRT